MTSYEDYLKEQRLMHENLQVLFKEIASQGIVPIVKAAVALYQDAETFLEKEPWITDNCREAKESLQKWLKNPCEETAKLVAEQAALCEQRGDAADEQTTIVGDWWSYQAVTDLHALCEYVALYSGLPDPCPDDLSGLTADNEEGLKKAIIGICNGYSFFPASQKRNYAYLKRVIENGPNTA